MTPQHQIPPLRRRAAGAGFLLLLLFVWHRGQGAAGEAPGPLADRLEGVRFREVAHELGIRFTHEATRVDERIAHVAAHVTAVGAGVSVTDADADGWPDLYAVTSAHGARNALFVNRGGTAFEDVAPAAGLADLNREGEGCSMGSVWADADGDGREDVYVYKWGRGQLFLNRGALRFADATPGSGLERWMNGNAATWTDYDRDGVLDLYVAGYFPEEHDLWNLRTTRIFHDSFEFARNGGRNYLYRGRGDGTFEDVTDEVCAGTTRWTYAAVAADLDRDGWPDLYVANDYGTEELFLNREGRRFELAADAGLSGESKSGMCVALGDVRNEGRLAVFVTNISRRGFLFQGNNLRLNLLPETGTLVQTAGGAVADCGWAWPQGVPPALDQAAGDLGVACELHAGAVEPCPQATA